eukprot:TRINITY_DN3724_c2_g1_i1.p1 TRINITY_DN3724_c2_g1~~TRINITY_DN3724_c2_g1_i1.p1  ORF type:complete len:345 (-),score=29.42 TRINITY_DN3724_c2_g1_i1:819-1853(-)
MEIMEFMQKLPKIELHAHLNGSIKDNYLKQLVQAKYANQNEKELKHTIDLLEQGDRSLDAVFNLFGVIHSITTEHHIISDVTFQVLEDFRQDGVIYLELRTTPKERPEYSITKQTYLEAVFDGLQRFNQQDTAAEEMMVRLILCIDRKEDTQAAINTVELAQKYKQQGIVGIDLCGNPTMGNWETWLPALQLAKNYGLRITLHAGEVWNKDETMKILRFCPDRIAHMVCTDEEIDELLLEKAIPVELCLSSNVISNSVASYSSHHLLQLKEKGHPFMLCTDDSGVFRTSLSNELTIACKHLGFTKYDVVNLQLNSIPYTFISQQEQLELKEKFDNRLILINGFI